MENTLTTTTAVGSGDQNTTQSPQSATAGNTGGASTSGVQPGTTSSLLDSSVAGGGVALTPTSVSTVRLGSSVSGTNSADNTVPQHHISTALIILPVMLFLLAASLVWWATRSAKSTTY